MNELKVYEHRKKMFYITPVRPFHTFDHIYVDNVNICKDMLALKKARDPNKSYK